MKSLKVILKEAQKKKVAVGHFNISDLVALKAIFGAAKDVGVPVIIGVSEGERKYVGVQQAAALVASLRKEYDFPIYLNADHTYTLEGVKKAAEAGFDMVIFDGAKLSREENTAQTKEAVAIARAAHKKIVVEGELGYIGSSSKLLDEVPEGALTDESKLPTGEEAKKFVEETGVDALAPAVGNLHGMMKNASNPNLNIARIKEIAKAARVPLVLHGGSGVSDMDFREAIRAGMAAVHINTEIRVAWRKGLEQGLVEHKDEIAPYKILPAAERAVYEVVKNRLQLFHGA